MERARQRAAEKEHEQKRKQQAERDLLRGFPGLLSEYDTLCQQRAALRRAPPSSTRRVQLMKTTKALTKLKNQAVQRRRPEAKQRSRPSSFDDFHALSQRCDASAARASSASSASVSASTSSSASSRHVVFPQPANWQFRGVSAFCPSFTKLMHIACRAMVDLEDLTAKDKKDIAAELHLWYQQQYPGSARTKTAPVRSRSSPTDTVPLYPKKHFQDICHQLRKILDDWI